MKPRCGIRFAAAPGALGPVNACCLAILVGWQAALGPALAASGTLRFNGTNQFVELPLGETIAMDNLGPRFAVSPAAAWTEAGGTHAYQGSCLETTEAGAQARWRPRLPRAGQYDVYAWWGRIVREGANVPLDRTARYTVKHADGLATVVVDQNARPGQWVLLGSYAFAADGEESVSVQRASVGTAPTVADAVQFVTAGAFDLTQTLTIEAWIKIAAFDRKWQAVVTKGNAWGLTRYDDTDRLTFRTHDGATAHDLISGQALETNRWYHVAGVCDGSRKLLYVDGAVSASAPYTATLVTSIRPVMLGANPENPDGDFKGALDNVRIWSAARSPEDLVVGASHHLRGNEAGLIGDWRLDEPSGLQALDSAQWGLHGALGKSNAPPARAIEVGFAFDPPPAGSLALRFNGYDQSVAVPANPRFDFDAQGTIETWLHFDFAPEVPVSLISKGEDSWELALDANQQLVFHTPGVTEPAPDDAATLVPASDLVSRTRLERGAWYHVAARWNGVAGRKDIYLNGQLDVSATNLQGQIAANTRPVRFAARPSDSTPSNYFDGALDEVRLWSVARESRQIADNFGRNLNGTEPGLASAPSK